MKIALVVHRFFPDGVGGVETLAAHLARALRERGHDVFLLCASRERERKRQRRFGLRIEMRRSAKPSRDCRSRSVPISCMCGMDCFSRLRSSRAFIEWGGRWCGRFRIIGPSAGRLVIGARLGQMERTIEPGRNGWLFERADVRDLAAVLKRIVERPEDWPRLREGIRPFEEMVREYEALYRECVERHGREISSGDVAGSDTHR